VFKENRKALGQNGRRKDEKLNYRGESGLARKNKKKKSRDLGTYDKESNSGRPDGPVKSKSEGLSAERGLKEVGVKMKNKKKLGKRTSSSEKLQGKRKGEGHERQSQLRISKKQGDPSTPSRPKVSWQREWGKEPRKKSEKEPPGKVKSDKINK